MSEANEDEGEHLLSRARLTRLLIGDMLVIIIWVFVTIVISKVTDRTTFLGFEGWQIKVTAAVLGIIPTATLLLIGWDDMDALWMVVRTRRFKRRQRYRDLIRDSQTQPSVDDPPALPPSEDKEVDTSV